jgi:hypothetical protein
MKASTRYRITGERRAPGKILLEKDMAEKKIIRLIRSQK